MKSTKRYHLLQRRNYHLGSGGEVHEEIVGLANFIFEGFPIRCGIQGHRNIPYLDCLSCIESSWRPLHLATRLCASSSSLRSISDENWWRVSEESLNFFPYRYRNQDALSYP